MSAAHPPTQDTGPETRARRGRKDRILLALAAGAILFSSLLWAWYIIAFGVDIPRMDQLNTPGEQIAAAAQGELDFNLLIKQHNESRKLLPNLISLSLYEIRGYWDLRAELLMGWLMGVLCLVAIAQLSWLTTRKIVSTAALTALFSGLLWSSHTFYFHFFSVTFERYLPQLLLLFITMGFFRYGVSWSAVVFASLASAMSQFSYASGVVVWPLALALILLLEPGEVRKNGSKILFFLLSAAPFFWLFFRDYVTPGHHTPLTAILDVPLSSMFLYVIHFVGNGITNNSVSITIIGVLFLGMYLALVTYVFVSGRNDPAWRGRVVWVVVGSYSLAQATLSMIGRLQGAMMPEDRLDYVTHPFYLITSVLALLLLTVPPRAQRKLHVIGIALALALASTSLKPVLQERMLYLQSDLDYARSCFLLVDHFQEPHCLDSLHWHKTSQVHLLKRASPQLQTPVLESLEFGFDSDPHGVSWETRKDSEVATGVAQIAGRKAAAVVAITQQDGIHDVIRIERVGFTRSSSTGGFEPLADPSGWVMKIDRSRIEDPCALGIYAMQNESGVLHEITGARRSGCKASN
jgi:hypothetical protein